jgi:hypothetical protein
MEVRLGPLADRQGGGAGDGAREVYPLRFLTVMRERCSAGGVRDDGCGVGKSSGCCCAGSLELLEFFGGFWVNRWELL